VTRARGADARLDAATAQLTQELSASSFEEASARRLVERMALVFQGALLVQYGSPAVADAFCASRLAGDWGRAFGTLPASTPFSEIIARARVQY
jgi:putative acyl-CoA dehydrogenase